jgi:hypothetical protein
MASINQLISEIAHSVQQADSVPVRRAIKLGIIHARNELIRKSYGNHNYTDKGLQQRFRLSLIDVPDGDQANTPAFSLPIIKRTSNKVPRPVRLTNNLPFHSVRTAGVMHPVEIAFVKEAAAQYYKHLPGMQCCITYDYQNEYIYINTINNGLLNSIKYITIESVFEQPQLILTETSDKKVDIDSIDDNDEFLLPEDMISSVKDIILKSWNGNLQTNVVRETNEEPSINLTK